VTHLPFAFWLRLPCILADAGSVLVVWKYFARTNVAAGRAVLPAGTTNLTTGQLASLLVLALSPVSLVISGYHGNTDSLMIFLALLSLFLVEGRRRDLAFFHDRFIRRRASARSGELGATP